MRAEDMSSEQLADALHDVYMLRITGDHAAEIVAESIRRLRNSIDRPTVEVREKTSPLLLTGRQLWFMEVNGYPVAYDRNVSDVRYQCRVLRTALGMEGGG